MKNKSEDIKINKTEKPVDDNKTKITDQEKAASSNQSNSNEEKYKKELIEKDKKISELNNQINQLNNNFKIELEKRAKLAQEQVNKKVSEIIDKYSNEAKENKKYAIKEYAEELINIISQINAVISSSENNPDPAIKNYVVGFKLYMNMFDNLLTNMGIKEIPVKIGDQFDHNKMEAIDTEKSSIKSNHVTKIIKKGYILHDRVIVYAQVIVSK